MDGVQCDPGSDVTPVVSLLMTMLVRGAKLETGTTPLLETHSLWSPQSSTVHNSFYAIYIKLLNAHSTVQYYMMVWSLLQCTDPLHHSHVLVMGSNSVSPLDCDRWVL